MNTTRKASPRFKSRSERIKDAQAVVLEIQAGTSDNDEAAFNAFAEKGYPLDSIEPRVTILTFAAWAAYGRHVRKGEKGTAVTVWKPLTRRDESGASVRVMRRDAEGNETTTPVLIATTSHLFHIAQTDPDETPHANCWTLNRTQREALALTMTPPPATALDAETFVDEQLAECVA